MRFDVRKAWGRGLTPREWQREALPLIIDALQAKGDTLAVAVMGSGKSYLLRELIKCANTGNRECILVVAPKKKIMLDLAEDIRCRIGGQNVGVFYAAKKEINKVICTTYQSLTSVTKALMVRRIRCGLAVLDEAHRTETDEVHRAIRALKPSYLFGTTATPYRESSRETLSLFSNMSYRLSVDEALESGIIVPWVPINYTGKPTGVDQAAYSMVRDAIKNRRGPILVNADDIRDAERFAHILRRGGVRAEAIHSRHNDVQQASLIERLKTGQLQALVHVSLLTEGVNLPWLTTLVLRRGAGGKRSRVAFAQEVGRVLRSHPGKTVAYVYDPLDLFGKIKLTYAAAVGEPEEYEGTFRQTAIRLSGGGRRKHNLDTPQTRRAARAQHLELAKHLLRRLTIAFSTCGLIELEKHGLTDSRLTDLKTGERFARISGHLVKLRVAQNVPHHIRVALAEVWDEIPCMTRADALDFQKILMVIARDGWPTRVEKLLHSGAYGRPQQ